MFLGGEWLQAGTGDSVLEVKNPYSAEILDTVPEATPSQVEAALDAAVKGARTMSNLPAFRRAEILHRAAALLENEVEEVATLLTAEQGKPIQEARMEVGRVPALLRLAAFEGTQLRGETLPLDAETIGVDHFGYTVLDPCGVVLAITPFNFPLMLVAHKIGPALAAGNAVILKPASETPLVALRMTEILLEAGLPELGIQCITGPGASTGQQLAADDRVRKVTFTGSVSVGEEVARTAGIKRISLELGANCPVIVLPDADIDIVAAGVARSGYINAGQICISTQRVLVDQHCYHDFLDAVAPLVSQIRLGDPSDDATKLSAMISVAEAKRVMQWIDEALEGGASAVTGHTREGAMLAPSVIADVHPKMKISSNELFGPAIAVTPVSGLDEAVAFANDSDFGLSASIFTSDASSAHRFIQEAEFGVVNVNGTPTWRADLMPFGGRKKSGIGKEGPRYAVREMTDSKTVVWH